MITPVTEVTKLMFFKHYDRFIGEDSSIEPFMRYIDNTHFVPHEEVINHIREVIDDECNNYLYNLIEQENT